MKADPKFAAGLVLALLVAALPSWVIGGSHALSGYLLGLAAAAFSFAGLAGVVWLLGKGNHAENPPLAPTVILLLAFFIKLPVYTVAAVFAQGLNPPGPDCFAVAVVLVYSAALSLLVVSGKSD